MTGIAIEDLLDYVLPVGLTSSRSGLAVWSEKSINKDIPQRPVAHLVVCPKDASPRPLTDSGERLDMGAAISHDEQSVAFIRRAVGDKPSETELCVVTIATGAVRVVAKARGDFSGLAWSPNGTDIAFSFRRADPVVDGASAPLSIRVRRAHYKLDGYGFLPQDRNRIYIAKVDVVSGDVDALAKPLELGDPDGAWDDTGPIFSPDGRWLAFRSNRRPNADLDAENNDLFVLSLNSGKVTQCTHHEGPLLKAQWAPDGSWIAAFGCFGPSGSMLMRAQVGLLSIDPTGERDERNLSEGLDHSLMNLTIDDLWGLEEWAQRPVFSSDGRTVLAPVSERGTTWLASFPVDLAGTQLGEPSPLVTDRSVVSFGGGDVLCALTTSPDTPGWIERFAIEGGERTVVSKPLAQALEGKAIALPHKLAVESEDGTVIHGWLYLPSGDGPHPLLLNIHGGPVVQFGTGFFHEVQTFVAAGYAVLNVNPRGSQGYGLEFCSAIKRDWARKPHQDLSAVLDHVIESHPIDSDRVGIMGGSYGGYMTNWMIAHTDRFKSACTQRTVAQMDAMLWSDFGSSFGGEIGSWPWDDQQHYLDQSPLTYAANINTPLLILQGLADHRTPVDQGERLFVTLKVLGKEVEMVLFPGGSHGLSRGGKPEQRIERLRVIHEWFERTL